MKRTKPNLSALPHQNTNLLLLGAIPQTAKINPLTAQHQQCGEGQEQEDTRQNLSGTINGKGGEFGEIKYVQKNQIPQEFVSTT